MTNNLDVARGLMERTIARNLQAAIQDFYAATGAFPRRVTVELGELIHINNVEMPRITVKVE